MQTSTKFRLYRPQWSSNGYSSRLQWVTSRVVRSLLVGAAVCSWSIACGLFTGVCRCGYQLHVLSFIILAPPALVALSSFVRDVLPSQCVLLGGGFFVGCGSRVFALWLGCVVHNCALSSICTGRKSCFPPPSLSCVCMSFPAGSLVHIFPFPIVLLVSCPYTLFSFV